MRSDGKMAVSLPVTITVFASVTIYLDIPREIRHFILVHKIKNSASVIDKKQQFK